MEAKETYYGSKRDLLWKQKRPTMEAKETYYGSKRDLLWKQKRPTITGVAGSKSLVSEEK